MARTRILLTSLVAVAALVGAGDVQSALARPGPDGVPAPAAAAGPTEVREVFSPDGTIDRVTVPARPPTLDLPDAVQADVVTIQQTGPSSQRFDLVFVGDGYTASQVGLYHQHVLTRWNEMTQVEPFKSLKSSFNVWQVNVASAESGVDNDPNLGVSRNTALDMGFWCGNLERLLCADDNKARQYAVLAPQVDQILALGNSTKYGGAGGGIATSSGGNGASGQIVVHELGHSIGGLADEYVSSDDTYAGPEFREPNASVLTADQMRQQQRKWASYLGKATPDGGVIGAYEGSAYHARGAYRPSQDSLMRTLGKPYNLIGLDTMRAAILAKTRAAGAGTTPQPSTSRGETALASR